MFGISGLSVRSLYDNDYTVFCPSTPSLIVATAVPSTNMVVTPLLFDAVITGVCPSCPSLPFVPLLPSYPAGP
jgi:hypothetical protein